MEKVKKTKMVAFVVFVGCVFIFVMFFWSQEFAKEASEMSLERVGESVRRVPSKNSEKVSTSVAVAEFNGALDDRSSHRVQKTSVLTLRQKLDNEKLLSEEYSRSLYGEVITLSDALLLKRLLDAGVEVPEDLAHKMKLGVLTKQEQDEISILVFSSRSEEEAFLDDAKDSKQIIAAAKERQKETGKYYGNKVLEHPIAYRNAKFGEIAEVLNEGAVLPDDALTMMVMQKNLELAKELTNNGYELDVDYVNPRNGMTAIESFLDTFVIFPDGDGAQSAINTVNTLLELGVPSQIDNGTRDALDILLAGALNQESRDGAIIIAQVGEILLQRDFKLTRSHKELLAQNEEKYGDIFSNFLALSR